MKIFSITGARPQFIKLAPLSRSIEAFNQYNDRPAGKIDHTLLHSGQHFDRNMSDLFFEELDIPEPNYHLMVNSLSHGSMTGRMLENIEKILLKEMPDIVVVFGDTNTTIAGALAASKLHIPVAHIEAGLRSFNKAMPEEINRVLTDHMSSLLFCPTLQSVKNLEKENLSEGVHHVGDIMYDMNLMIHHLLEEPARVNNDYFEKDTYYLATLHRAENTDNQERLISILEALIELNQNKRVVLPLHPRTRQLLCRYKLNDLIQNLTVLEPVSYLQMMQLEKHASCILTDSGGVQKEAYFHSVPCVTLRDETEWTETVKHGWNIIAGHRAEDILQAVNASKQGTPIHEYGDGSATKKILDQIIDFLK